jgi:LmbE family N-acetylglucosaminyl deacetylase
MISLDSIIGLRVLLLSPHADDIAYSIGGTVALVSQCVEFHMLTIFGRSKWALQNVEYGQSIDILSNLRAEEDRMYCKRRGIQYAALSFLDSAGMGYSEINELRFGALEDSRTRAVADLLVKQVSILAPDMVITPAGVGGHVDHCIVRCAAERLRDVKILYYEDVPYGALQNLQTLEEQLCLQGLEPAVVVDIGSVLSVKCEDMWSYCSQTRASDVEQMLNHARRIGPGVDRYAERLWHQVGNSRI